MDKIKIAIADDHPVVREGLALVLNTDKRLELVGVFSDGNEFLKFLEYNSIDIIILDKDIPGDENFSILKIIKNNYPSVKVVIFTMHTEVLYFLKAKLYGADSYIIKTESITFMPTIIQYVMKGEFYCSEELKNYMGNFKNTIHLNPIELEIVNYLKKGNTYKEIANIINRSEKTIEYHTSKIRKKLIVKNNLELISKISNY